MSARILIADDDPANLERVSGYFSGSGHEVHSCGAADSAWQALSASAPCFDLLIVDRMLATSDGVSLLGRIKNAPRLARLPRIVLSAASPPEQFSGAGRTGACHYLSKPCEAASLLATARAALGDASQGPEPRYDALQLMQAGRFQLSTLEEASQLANFLAHASLCPESSVLGLSELLINSIEHGNLGITYAEKSELKRSDAWRTEVERRGLLAENRGKRVTVEFSRAADRLTIRISDEGEGFDWQKYLDFDPERAFDLNGRGIALARASSFDTLTYEGGGNVVVATILNKKNEPKPCI